MALTTAQKATLAAAIAADSNLTTFVQQGNDGAIADYYKAASTTNAWKTSVSPQTSDEAANYTNFDALVAGKRDSWGIFLMFSRDFNKAKIRNWIVDVWGAATAASVAESVLQAGTEKANKGEMVFSTTTKTTGTVTAVDRSYVGTLTANDIANSQGR